MIHTKGSGQEAWSAFCRARDSGETVQVDAPMYWYWLDVLPPVFMNRFVHFPDGHEVYADFGFREGDLSPGNPTIAFWKSGGRYFCKAVPLPTRPAHARS